MRLLFTALSEDAEFFHAAAKCVPEDVVNTLANFDVESLPTVEKGQPAPDFTLKSLDGPEFTLSQFKGVKPVVLVFVYGDT